MACAARQQTWSISFAPPLSWLAKLARVIAVWHRRARERQALGRLGDHYLRDIGLTRHDITIECGKPFWRR